MLIRHESGLTRRSTVMIVSRNMSVELLDYEAHLDLVLTAIWSDQKFKARPEVRARQTVILEHHTRFSCSMGPALSALTVYWTLLFPLFFVDSKYYFWHSRSGLQHVTDLRSSLNFYGLIIEITNLIKVLTVLWAGYRLSLERSKVKWTEFLRIQSGDILCR